MKTTEVNQSLIGKRVEGIAFGEMVKGIVTAIEVNECSAIVYFDYDEPQNWGGDLYRRGDNWARLFDEFGSLHYMRVIE